MKAHGPAATSTDTLLGGELELLQHLEGYRYSIDAVLLAGTADLSDVGRIVDVGCGVGVVGLVAATRARQASIALIEIQPALAELARRNVVRNGFEGRATVIEGDVRAHALRAHALQAGPFDLALINPPFYTVGGGRLSAKSERAAARHELHGALPELLGAARLLIKRGGSVRVIYPAEALTRLLKAIDSAHMFPASIMPVHSFAHRPAKLVLCDARQSGRRELCIEPPLVIFEAEGIYTSAVANILERGGAETMADEVES